MKFIRSSKILDQIINQHMIDPISEVYLDALEFEEVVNTTKERNLIASQGDNEYADPWIVLKYTGIVVTQGEPE